MPEKRTVERARKKARAGKAPTTQAGEFVREEIRHVREGKHGARSKKCDAIAMASHGRGGVGGLILGSETARVLAHSKIPVLVRPMR